MLPRGEVPAKASSYQHPQDCDPLSFASYFVHSSLCHFIPQFLNLFIVMPLFFSLPCPFSSTTQSATAQKAGSHSLSAISFFSACLYSLEHLCYLELQK